MIYELGFQLTLLCSCICGNNQVALVVAWPQAVCIGGSLFGGLYFVRAEAKGPTRLARWEKRPVLIRILISL